MRLIENLASRNSTKNTDIKRKISATTLGKDQLDDGKAKLDIVHKLLKKHVSFAEDVEAVNVDSDINVEEVVNIISGTVFQNQRSGNQSGYKNSYGNKQRSSYNHCLQY